MAGLTLYYTNGVGMPGNNPSPGYADAHYINLGAIEVSKGFKTAWPTATIVCWTKSNISLGAVTFQPCNSGTNGPTSVAGNLNFNGSVQQFQGAEVRWDKTQLMFDPTLARELTDFLGVTIN